MVRKGILKPRKIGRYLAFTKNELDHIVANGAFYTFDVTVTGFGGGQFALDPPALIAEQFNPSAPGNPILRDVATGPPLSFSVIPEPLTVVGLALGVGCLAHRLYRRRRQG